MGLRWPSLYLDHSFTGNILSHFSSVLNVMSLSKRDRSLEGCGTCRTRHVKRDAQRPVCQMCIISNVPCTGYEIRLRFVHHGEPEPLGIEDATRFRRPLFTGKSYPEVEMGDH